MSDGDGAEATAVQRSHDAPLSSGTAAGLACAFVHCCGHGLSGRTWSMQGDLPETELLPLRGRSTRVDWRRSARARRVTLRIDPRAGTVVITLPPRAGRRAGLALLTTHADWVADRLAALPGAVPFADGASVPLHGVPHTIRHVGGRVATRAEHGAIIVGGEAPFLPRRVTDYLRAAARQALTGAVQAQAARIGRPARRVTVKDTRSRWGSCAPDGSISFSWRLVMAPDWVQHYVAAHEAAHLRHLNHGAQFWALCRSLTPHTDAAQEWLRREGPGLLRIG